MKKLALELDSLGVESFDTLPARRSHRGTVDGFEYTLAVDCPDDTRFTGPQIKTTGLTTETDGTWGTVGTGGTGGTGGGGGTTELRVTDFESCVGTCWNQQTCKTCVGQPTCEAQVCIRIPPS